jgi:multidrug efflux system membrane fusion protein
MLFKPDPNGNSADAADGATGIAGRARRRIVSIFVTLLILGGLGYIAWSTFLIVPKRNTPPDLPVPVLAATPQQKDVPVYLDGVGQVKALNTVTVRAQVDGKLIAIKFAEGQDVQEGDVLALIDPAIYKAQYDQAVAKKAQDEATLTNAKLDLVRYQQLALSNAGSKQQADTQKALVDQLSAQVRADQGAVDNAQTTLGYTTITAPIAGRTGLRQVDQGNIVHASDATGLVVITQVKPIAVWFSLPQQQINQVNAAFAKGQLDVDVFGNDGRTVVQSGALASIDNQVDPTTGTLKFKAQFPNARLLLWPGQFANVRLKVDTLKDAIVVPTSSVQRGPVGTYVYVIGDNNTVTAKPVNVTQQNDVEAVIGSGLTTSERVVTTGFANLADGSRVIIGREETTPAPDLAPRRKGGARKDGKDKAGQKGADAGAPAAQPQAMGQGGGPAQGSSLGPVQGQAPGQGAKQGGDAAPKQ